MSKDICKELRDVSRRSPSGISGCCLDAANEIEVLRAEKEALRRYANHTSDCNLSSIYQSVALRGCNCGFDALAEKEE